MGYPGQGYNPMMGGGSPYGGSMPSFPGQQSFGAPLGPQGFQGPQRNFGIPGDGGFNPSKETSFYKHATLLEN